MKSVQDLYKAEILEFRKRVYEDILETTEAQDLHRLHPKLDLDEEDALVDEIMDLIFSSFA